MIKPGTKVYVKDEEIDVETGLSLLKLVTVKYVVTEYEVVDDDGHSDIITLHEIVGLPYKE